MAGLVRIFFIYLLVALLVGGAVALLLPRFGHAAPMVSQAVPVAAAQHVPLMVVRFNQRRVYYERQLQHVVSKAKRIKPDVQIELVSYFPASAGGQQHGARQSQLQQVVGSLRKLGIPRQRIRTVASNSSMIRHHEVHLFVE